MNKSSLQIWIKRIISIFLSLYIILCILFYLFQETVLFHPQKLDKEFVFKFEQNFEQITIETAEKTLLHGLLFTADSTKGLIFYLHGNAGALDSWGHVAKYYTNLNYDVFILDYRGFGKSEGNIKSENQLFNDIQTVYDKIKERYSEDQIIVLGYSIGTGLATKLASTNSPKMLILQAPYYNMTNVIQSFCPIIPDFTVRYKLNTNRYITYCKMPIIIYHGNKDRTINYNNSLKLKELLKPNDTLIILDKQTHNGITENSEYLNSITEILTK